jgi:4-amino-4-deoxy-L-arabinose transferase-like glycosyltransferase
MAPSPAPRRDRYEPLWQEGLSLLGLFLLSAIALGWSLPSLPLQPGLEADLYHLARTTTLTTLWADPLMTHSPWHEAPLVPYLVVGAAQGWGASLMMLRLPTALLTAGSVMLLYGVTRELFPGRWMAILAGVVDLVLLPTVNGGRIAQPLGALWCWETLLLWTVLRSRRDWRWLWGMTAVLNLLALTQPGSALIMTLGILTFYAADTPRLLHHPWFWLGLGVGNLPWIGSAVGQAGPIITVDQGLTSVVLYGHHPWLTESWFALSGLALVWGGCQQTLQRSRWSWSLLLRIWLLVVGLGFGLILPSQNPLLLVLPLFAILATVQLWDLQEQIQQGKLAPHWRRGSRWISGVTVLSVLVAVLILKPVQPPLLRLGLAGGAIALTYTMVARLMALGDRQFLPLLLWGLYIVRLLTTPQG